MKTKIVISCLSAVCIATCLLFIGCAAGVKVKVEYRKEPILAGLTDKTVMIGAIQNDANFPQAPRDIESYLSNASRKENFFRQIITTKVPMPFPYTDDGNIPFKSIVDNPSQYDWQTWNKKIDSDYLLLGRIFFKTNDVSGYESRWVTNRAGYRVPQRIWVDKIAYDYILRLVLIDLRKGIVALDKQYKDKDDVKGAADEVAVFLELTEKRTNEFLDQLVGKKVKSHRFLLYE